MFDLNNPFNVKILIEQDGHKAEIDLGTQSRRQHWLDLDTLGAVFGAGDLEFEITKNGRVVT